MRTYKVLSKVKKKKKKWDIKRIIKKPERAFLVYKIIIKILEIAVIDVT